MRYLWALLGMLCVALAIVGIFVPILPTAPLLILAAFIFSRSSERLHNWLLSHPTLSVPIADWRDRRAINPMAKRLATASIVVVFSISLLIGLRPGLLALQGALLIAVLIFIWTRPNA